MTATAASVEAQAKINLRLKVLAREATGYHQLESLFLRVELHDSIRVATDTAGRRLECPGLAVPMERNLAFQAAEAYAAAAGWPTGFHIVIEKRIPAGGGLGGGSADAGAVLRALNALAPRPLALEALLGVALRLGADVPFLATDAAFALGWGRGERLLALRPLPARDVVLAFPTFGVETAAAFGWHAARPAAAAPTVGVPWTLDLLDRWETVYALAENDLEATVAARHPEIASCVRAFGDAGARVARMSGSGSTVFGIFDRRLVADPTGVPAGTRLVHTRTATSVAPVRPLD